MAEALKGLDYQQAMRMANAMGMLARAARFRAKDAAGERDAPGRGWEPFSGPGVPAGVSGRRAV